MDVLELKWRPNHWLTQSIGKVAAALSHLQAIDPRQDALDDNDTCKATKFVAIGKAKQW